MYTSVLLWALHPSARGNECSPYILCGFPIERVVGFCSTFPPPWRAPFLCVRATMWHRSLVGVNRSDRCYSLVWRRIASSSVSGKTGCLLIRPKLGAAHQVSMAYAPYLESFTRNAIYPFSPRLLLSAALDSSRCFSPPA